MNAREVTDLNAHREHTPGDHHTRLDYEGFVELLEDADRVVDDLIPDGRLLVSPGEIEFSVRRLRAMLRGAMRSARDIDAAEVPQ